MLRSTRARGGRAIVQPTAETTAAVPTVAAKSTANRAFSALTTLALAATTLVSAAAPAAATAAAPAESAANSAVTVTRKPEINNNEGLAPENSEAEQPAEGTLISETADVVALPAAPIAASVVEGLEAPAGQPAQPRILMQTEPQQASAVNSAQVSGRITVPAGFGTADIQVMAIRPDGTGWGGTNVDGVFNFSSLEPGVWRIEAQVRWNATGEVVALLSQSQTVTLAAGDQLTVDFDLEIGATIRGRVLLPAGMEFVPEQFEVHASRTPWDPNIPMANTTWIGSDGEFLIGNLFPGTYQISAGPRWELRDELNLVMPGSGTVPLEIHGTEAHNGFDLQLVRTFAVEGTITAPAGFDLSTPNAIAVTVNDAEGNQTWVPRGTVTFTPDGEALNFRVSGLFAGSYNVTAQGNAGEAVVLLGQTLPLTLGESSVSGLDFEMVQGAGIRGQIVMPNNEPIPPGSLSLAAQRTPWTLGVPTPRVTNLGGGHFLIGNLIAGDYTLLIQPNAGFDAVLRNQPVVSVVDGQTTEGIVLQLERTTFIDGTITAPVGFDITGLTNGARDLQVSVRYSNPDNPFDSWVRTSNTAFTVEGNQLNFRIGGVFAGDYQVEVNARTLALAPLMNQTARVVVGAEGYTGVNFNLEVGPVVTGRVLPVAGQAVVRINSLNWYDLNQTEHPNIIWPNDAGYFAIGNLTNTAGFGFQFRNDGGPANNWRVDAVSTWEAARFQAGATVVDVQTQLYLPGEIAGTVTETDVYSEWWAAVRATPVAGSYGIGYESDWMFAGDGEFFIEGLLPGFYNVTVMLAGGVESAPLLVEVIAGETVAGLQFANGAWLTDAGTAPTPTPAPEPGPDANRAIELWLGGVQGSHTAGMTPTATFNSPHYGWGTWPEGAEFEATWSYNGEVWMAGRNLPGQPIINSFAPFPLEFAGQLGQVEGSARFPDGRYDTATSLFRNVGPMRIIHTPSGGDSVVGDTLDAVKHGWELPAGFTVHPNWSLSCPSWGHDIRTGPSFVIEDWMLELRCSVSAMVSFQNAAGQPIQSMSWSAPVWLSENLVVPGAITVTHDGVAGARPAVGNTLSIDLGGWELPAGTEKHVRWGVSCPFEAVRWTYEQQITLGEADRGCTVWPLVEFTVGGRQAAEASVGALWVSNETEVQPGQEPGTDPGQEPGTDPAPEPGTEVEGPQPVFPDVPANNQFAAAIQWKVDQGITTGFADGTFRPGNHITREAMAAFLFRAAGRPEFTAPDSPTFSDVIRGASNFFHEIEWLSQSGITGGFQDGTFRPGANVNRGAMAAFLFRAAGRPEFTAPETPTFVDVPTDFAFFHEVEWLASTGITTGWTMPDGTREFRPGSNVTRESTAAFMYRQSNLGLLFPNN